jgi:hypothetical protein
VVPYETAVVGDDRQMMVYDNNNPYRENETGSEDPSVAHIAWGANTFSYVGATTAYCVSYDECTPATRHLPGSEFGGPGSSTVVAVVEPGTELQQITDEAGRTFFNPDGSLNDDPNTRIPMSLKLGPLVDTPALRLPTARALRTVRFLSQDPGVPEDWPGIYVFSSAHGKSLTFDLAPGENQVFRFFGNGLVASVEGSGPGRIRLNDLLNAREMEILTPDTLLPDRVEVIRSMPTEDRVFELNNLRNMGTDSLKLVLAPDGSNLNVEGAAQLLFDMEVQGLVGPSMQVADFANVGLAANCRAVLSPLNWGNLQTSGLQLKLQNLQTNRVQSQVIPRIEK